ncbi:hypothetical protein PAMP_022603 [Pampus punctatissimus]
MHISFMASYPTKLKILKLSLPNIQQAEKDYIRYIFNGAAPLVYKEKRLQPMKGITLPVGNTIEEIQASTCAISDYLDNHLPAIMRNLTLRHQDIIENTDTFYHQFKALKQLGSHQNTNCHRDVLITNNYNMKPLYTRKGKCQDVDLYLGSPNKSDPRKLDQRKCHIREAAVHYL